jgi:ADP-ribose pyrophosphatase
VAERLLRRQTLAEGRLLTFRLDIVADAEGAERRREVVVHPGAVAIAALTADRQLLLVRQYRHAVGEVCLEVPAGTLDRAADGTPEQPDLAARRELAEETGYAADDWRLLGRFWTAPGFATEEMHLFLANRLKPAGDHAGPAADERLELVSLPLGDALALVEAGEIRDAKTLVALLWLGRLAEQGTLPG